MIEFVYRHVLAAGEIRERMPAKRQCLPPAVEKWSAALLPKLFVSVGKAK